MSPYWAFTPRCDIECKNTSLPLASRISVQVIQRRNHFLFYWFLSFNSLSFCYVRFSPHGSTGCPKSHYTKKNLNIFTTLSSNELRFFSNDRGEFKVFFHKNQVYKYFELLPLASIMKFSIFCRRYSENILHSIFNFHMTIR